MACALALAATSAAVRADDVAKKWRFGLALGGFNSQDEIQSSAANEMFTIDPCARTRTCTTEDAVVRVFFDPRKDSQVFGNLDINPALLGTFSVQYGVNKIFLVEGSVGYRRATVGDVSVDVLLFGNRRDVDDPSVDYLFASQRVPVGELEQVPIQITALARMRPRATFNPYFGAGVGYSIVGLETDPAFDLLSRRMDASRGVQMRLTPIFSAAGPAGNLLLTDNRPQEDLQGATLEARDTFEWHLVTGAELTIKKRWSAFVDLRWVDASRSVAIGFNGDDELGNSLPNYQPYNDTAIANARYGPVQIGSCAKDTEEPNLDQRPVPGEPIICGGGGLADFGYAVVEPSTDDIPLDCKNDPSDIASNFCVVDFIFEPDGVPDPGPSYAKGGTIDYDGWSAQFGVRFTFGK